MTTSLTTIELSAKHLCFSAAHFTIFSNTSRERLHGHNYRVKAFITCKISEQGISFDYDIFVDKLMALCQQLDRYLLLPGKSPALKIKEQDHYYHVDFNNEKMQFLKSDTLILPIRNITIEELSRWFLEALDAQENNTTNIQVQELVIKVSNGDGRWGSSHLSFL